MNKQAHIERVAAYILDQDHEFDGVVDDLCQYELNERKGMRDHARNTVWYSAILLIHGKREAEKSVSEAIREATPYIKACALKEKQK